MFLNDAQKWRSEDRTILTKVTTEMKHFWNLHHDCDDGVRFLERDLEPELGFNQMP